jgi:hypothetical protein
MAARLPRRSFATPFVITLAAAPAACYVQGNPPPSTYPQEPAPAPSQTPPPTQTPPPVEQTNPNQPPPTVITNPPRPQNPDTQVQATNQTSQWTVFKSGDGCQAAVKTECPKGAMCNPPPPIKYACPENVTLPVTVVTRDGGATCAIEFPMPSCPPNAACNPPRPRPVACPKR